jgi:hypothetical protein
VTNTCLSRGDAREARGQGPKGPAVGSKRLLEGVSADQRGIRAARMCPTEV